MNTRMMFAALTLICLAGTSSALRNPAAVYCDFMGHNYTVERTAEGDVGYCTIAGAKVDAWEFLQGKTARDASFCAAKGLQLRISHDTKVCGRLMTDSCAVCVKDGKEVEVTELAGLDFLESRCGDGSCSFPESEASCPKDCKLKGSDGLCKPLNDGVCDTDCKGGEDPDCQVTSTTITQTEGKDEPQGGAGCIPLLIAPLALAAAVISKAA